MREGYRGRLSSALPSIKEEKSLFLCYAQSPSLEIRLEIRNAIVEKYLPLARYITKKIAERLSYGITEKDDLRDAAAIGLINAVESFDAGRGIRFGTYAEVKIKGSINDELRTLDPLKRRGRQLLRISNRLHEELCQKLQRRPTDEEMREEMSRSGFSKESYATANRLNRLTYQDSQIGHDEETLLMSTGIPDIADYEASVKEMTSMALSRFTERERRIFYFRYWKNLTPIEIGEIEHVSDSLIWRIQKRALRNIRARQRFMESLETIVTRGSAA